MSRALPVAVILCLLFTGAGAAEEFDISVALRPSFSDIALLPSRLTVYNQHDDAATASYTCCKPHQHREILAAIRANEVFLDNHPYSDLADNALMHYAWVNSVRRDFRAQIAAYETLLHRYPDSHMADDAAWHLGRLYASDKDYPLAVQALTLLVSQFPTSIWADDAYMLLVQQYDAMDDEEGTIRALETLALRHPHSAHCCAALTLLARKYFEVASYDRAIETSELLIRRYPNSDGADDAQMMIADALRLSDRLREALDAYEYLIHRMYGSSHTNRAMREANNLIGRLRRQGQRLGGDLYDPLAWDPGREARELWETAQHHENYREYARAIELYRQFAQRFPGNDNLDDAFFRIGECYRHMKILFEEINASKGPEDLFRLSGRYAEATGAYQMIPQADEVAAIRDATAAYAVIVNHFHGSSLRDDALYQIARAYIPYEDPEAVPVDAAFTFQELMLNFPDSPHVFESLVKLIRFYARPANYEKAQLMYAQAAAALPGLFPPGLVADREAFLELMGYYARHTEHAWFECFHHHIPYVLSPPDLAQPALYYQSAMLMSRGEFPRAAQLLQQLAQARTGDFAAQSLYLLARCYQRMGNIPAAQACLVDLKTNFAHSGLADDAALLLAELDCPATEATYAQYAQQAEQALGEPVGHLDAHVGERIVVYAPYPVAALMRMYNMPNIWEEGRRVLEDWTGTGGEDKTLIYVDATGRQCAGNPLRVSARGIKDPPDWMLGLEQLSRNALTQALSPVLPADSPVLDGMCSFAAASLQYDLVTETRDAIGSASAVKLPQEAVLQARERALKCLEEYVRAAGDHELTGSVVAGMLYTLLDEQGFSREQLINREPYRAVFAAIRDLPAGYEGLPAFGLALDQAFAGSARNSLRQWGLPLAGLAPPRQPTASIGSFGGNSG